VKEYLDALNNWYIRRSRERFWGETGAADRQDAYDTLYTCLVLLCKAAAPMLPLLTEKVYTGSRARFRCILPIGRMCRHCPPMVS
jgi:isoleucyl-tRNA synthetase